MHVQFQQSSIMKATHLSLVIFYLAETSEGEQLG